MFRTHWNDAANLPWALGEVGKKSHIYRDETIVVTKVLSGSIAASSIIVRALGGTVGDMSIEYEEDVRLQAGKSYIGFLRREDTPTQEGSERFWTFVWQGNGVFTQTGTGWQNYAGMTASAADLVQ
ncbi:MAG: hypothetical protein DLM71_10530 [Chloroflexi bacterium]|nr:MAG: hypothetical protein DLM71_10530 [Chloroflexota bacterium]